MARMITVAGENKTVAPQSGKFRREELEELVGGLVEILAHSKSSYLIGNERGRIEKLQVNTLGSIAAGFEVVGTILDVPKTEVDFSQVNQTGNLIKQGKDKLKGMRIVESEDNPLLVTVQHAKSGKAFSVTTQAP